MPCLHVFTDDVVVHRVKGLTSTFETFRLPLLALSFDYGGLVVSARARGAPAEPSRSPVAEEHARRLLEGFGATDLECLDTHATVPGVQADYLVAPEGDASDFCTFQSVVIPQLRSLGFRVTMADDHEWKIVEPEPRWFAELEVGQRDQAGPRREDWFGLELGIDFGGQRVSLLPALLDLLEKSGSGEGLHDLARHASRRVALRVAEGVYLPLPVERLRGILRVLAELYEGRPPESGVLGIPPARVGALSRLDLVFRGEGRELRWFGGAVNAWKDASASLAPPPVAPPDALRAELRPYQQSGLAWLQHLRARGAGGILADDMGLGKTLQTIAHLALEKQQGRLGKPALIVAPTTLVRIWTREIARFAPGLRAIALYGPSRHALHARIDANDVVVTSYRVLLGDQERLAERSFSHLILDEAQTIKNEKCRAHRVARSLVAEHRLCLTGTPVENHLGELWALQDFLNPGLLGGERYFSRFFRGPIEKLKNTERLAALRAILAPYILRRTKAEVARELPPKTELRRPVELRGQQRELYESIRVAGHEEVRKIIRKKGLSASTIPILGALTKLRQVCCDPRLVPMSGVARGESAKLKVFEELTTQLLLGGHRVLVFSQFTSMLSLLAASLDERKIAYTTLTGSTVDRPAAISRFEQGEVDVFLISLRAGGTGLTLTGADSVIHYDPWWNPAVQAQATDRAHRIGQDKPVFVHHLFVAGSVEERMLRLQKRKRGVADAILGEGDAASALTEQDVELLFAPLGAARPPRPLAHGTFEAS